MRVLLVEPDYYTKFPPLGLLKISSYHKQQGDEILGLVKGKATPKGHIDRIYVTSLFTWAWRQVHDAVNFYKKYYPDAQVWLGGLYASLRPKHAKTCEPDRVFEGLFSSAEELMPDYELLNDYMPEWDGSIIFSSRGCNNNCGFCSVPILEGKINSTKKSIRHLIWSKYTRIIFWDNNFLQSPGRDSILDELEDFGLKVDFNQGLDACLITEKIAGRLANLNLDSGRSGVKIRLAYDLSHKGPSVKRAIERLNAAGIKGRKIMVYTLFNYEETPEDFLARVRDILHWGVGCYPMRYEPIVGLDKNRYISEKWTKKQVDMVQRARRVIGFGGLFPPYKKLIEKFDDANDFEEAFKLRPQNKVKSS